MLSDTSVVELLIKEYNEELNKYEELPPTFTYNFFDKLYSNTEENKRDGYNIMRIELRKNNVKFIYNNSVELSQKYYIKIILNYIELFYDGSFETVFYLNTADQKPWKDLYLPLFMTSKPSKERGFVFPHAWLFYFPVNREKTIHIDELINNIERSDKDISEKREIVNFIGTPNSLVRRNFLLVNKENKLIKITDSTKDKYIPLWKQNDFKFRLVLPGLRSYTVTNLLTFLTNTICIKINEKRIFKTHSTVEFSPFRCTEDVIGYGDNIMKKYAVDLDLISYPEEFPNKYNIDEIKDANERIEIFIKDVYNKNITFYNNRIEEQKYLAKQLLTENVFLSAFDYCLKKYTKLFKQDIIDELSFDRKYVYTNVIKEYKF